MDTTEKRVFGLLCDEAGATAIEFGLIAGFVSIVGIAAYSALGQSFVEMYTFIYGRVDQVAEMVQAFQGGSSP